MAAILILIASTLSSQGQGGLGTTGILGGCLQGGLGRSSGIEVSVKVAVAVAVAVVVEVRVLVVVNVKV